MKVSVVTPTKGRPLCLELCKKYVDRQTYKVHEHIIADGKSLYDNMNDALLKVTGDLVVIFEDDDWYDPKWVETCVNNISNGYDLFGQGKFFYYHLPSGGYIKKDAIFPHAPLHATSFKSELISSILSLPRSFKNQKPLFDKCIWNMDAKKHTIIDKFVVSLKGLPGTAGYSSAHSDKYYQYFDKNRNILKDWIGSDVELYKSIQGMELT